MAVAGLILASILSVDLHAESAKTWSAESLRGIYAGAGETLVSTAGVQLIQSGLKALYGVTLPRLEKLDSADSGEGVILLGTEASLATKRLSSDELQAVSPGGFVIRCDEGKIVIAGADEWATIHGIARFLEDLGLRFYQLAYQPQVFAPKPKSQEFPAIRIAEKPAFLFRPVQNTNLGGTREMLADPRNGLNPELFGRSTGSDLWIDHTAGYLVPKLLYYDEHPEYYAMEKSGKRVGKDQFSDHRTPLCLSNPDVLRIAIARALGWFEKEPQKRFFQITYGDTGVWCECESCRALDPAPGEYATRLLHWVNPIAKEVGGKFPGRWVITFAYGGTSAAPPVARPEKNVLVCASTGLGGIPFWDHAVAHQHPHFVKSLPKLESWLKIAPEQVSVCEYLSNKYEPALAETLSARLRFYAGKGIRGIIYTYGLPVNFRDLWQHVFAKLAWNPNRDVHQVAEDFIRFYYAEAAEPISRFLALSHERYRKSLEEKWELADLYPKGYYASDFVQAARSCFSEAEAIAKADRKATMRGEEALFLWDVLRHLPRPVTEVEGSKQMFECLERLKVIAEANNEDTRFIEAARAFGVEIEKSWKGSGKQVDDWLKKSFEMLRPPDAESAEEEIPDE